MSSLTTWVKSLVTEPQVPQKHPSHAIADTLMSEMDSVIKEMEAEKREEESERRRSKTGVDYSWLAVTPPKGFDLAPLDRLELEDLAMRVSPGECGRVLNLFRDAVDARNPEITEVPGIMRAVIWQVIEGRPKEDTMSEWMMKSLTSLAKYRPKSSKRIAPLQIDSDSTEASSPTRSDCSNIFMTSSSSHALVESVDQLPV